MDEDIKTTCKGYTITLEHRPTGKIVTVTLSEESEKWIVRGDGYQGFFKDLDHAYKEACRHLKFKLGGRMNEDE